MIDTIYIEEEIRNHPRVLQILERFPNARQIDCGRYGEVFNRKAQSFRLQKQKPALILAKKYGNFVLEVPEGYGIGSDRNFYFSHMMNCIYDCRYCFLQGMYESAHYVVFVNYEDFTAGIEQKIHQHPGENVHFFSGYDCDSLALESITGFGDFFLDFFEGHPLALVELRTKSIQIQSLLKRPVIPNCVVAFSLNPERIAEELEQGAPSVARRIEAMRQLQQAGWKIGLRFDPLIYTESFEDQYAGLFEDVFQKIDSGLVHSVSLGTFRLPKDMHERIYRLYPDEKFFSGPFDEKQKMVMYRDSIQEELFEKVKGKLLGHIPADIFFPCQ